LYVHNNIHYITVERLTFLAKGAKVHDSFHIGILFKIATFFTFLSLKTKTFPN